jgi:hypothetical protein
VESNKIRFSFFPEKINLADLRYWFTNGDKINLTIYSNKEKIEQEKTIELRYIETNLLKNYKELNRKYIFENNGLVFSIFTDYHIDELSNLEISLSKK